MEESRGAFAGWLLGASELTAKLTAEAGRRAIGPHVTVPFLQIRATSTSILPRSQVGNKGHVTSKTRKFCKKTLLQNNYCFIIKSWFIQLLIPRRTNADRCNRRCNA